MIERSLVGKLSWINLKNPTHDEIHEITETECVPLTLLSDLLAPVPRNYALTLDGYIKIVVDFPVVKRIDVEHPYEVKFIIGKRTLITVQYEEMEGMDRFKKQFEVITTLGKASKSLTGAHLFFSLMAELYSVASSKLDYVESSLSDIESHIFDDNERQMVAEIARTNKRLIAYRHVLRSHEDIFFESEPLFETVYAHAHRGDFMNMRKMYLLLVHRANALFETLSAIRDANDSMLTTKQNEIMKTLTIMAFVTFPLTLFSSMFGMNTTATPLLGKPHDFWIIIGIMVCAVVFFFGYFKFKNWL